MGLVAQEQGNQKVRDFQAKLAEYKAARLAAIETLASIAPSMVAAYQAVLADPGSTQGEDQPALLAMFDEITEGTGGVNEKYAALPLATRQLLNREHGNTVIPTS